MFLSSSVGGESAGLDYSRPLAQRGNVFQPTARTSFHRKQRRTTKDGTSVFPKEKFRYDAAADVYHCPGSHALPFQKKNLNRGQARGLYYDRAACQSCPLRKACTTGSCRVIGRHAQAAAVEATATRVLAAPEKVAVRKEIVEHVFGTLRLWGHAEFLMKGLR